MIAHFIRRSVSRRRVFVLARGLIIAEVSPHAIAIDTHVVEAYLVAAAATAVLAAGCPMLRRSLRGHGPLHGLGSTEIPARRPILPRTRRIVCGSRRRRRKSTPQPLLSPASCGPWSRSAPLRGHDNDPNITAGRNRLRVAYHSPEAAHLPQPDLAGKSRSRRSTAVRERRRKENENRAAYFDLFRRRLAERERQRAGPVRRRAQMPPAIGADYGRAKLLILDDPSRGPTPRSGLRSCLRLSGRQRRRTGPGCWSSRRGVAEASTSRTASYILDKAAFVLEGSACRRATTILISSAPSSEVTHGFCGTPRSLRLRLTAHRSVVPGVYDRPSPRWSAQNAGFHHALLSGAAIATPPARAGRTSGPRQMSEVRRTVALDTRPVDCLSG